MLIIVAMSLRELWSRVPQRLALFGSIALLLAPAIWLGFYDAYGKGYYGIDNDGGTTIATITPHDALVLMPPEQFGAFIWRNDPWLKRGPVYAENIGGENPKLISAFPGRRVFYLELENGDYHHPRILIATPTTSASP